MDTDEHAKRRRFVEVLLTFLWLGLTSFGGPVARLGYFRRVFVERRQWLTEDEYAEIIALCQFLPGAGQQPDRFPDWPAPSGIDRRSGRVAGFHPALRTFNVRFCCDGAEIDVAIGTGRDPWPQACRRRRCDTGSVEHGKKALHRSAAHKSRIGSIPGRIARCRAGRSTICDRWRITPGPYPVPEH